MNNDFRTSAPNPNEPQAETPAFYRMIVEETFDADPAKKTIMRCRLWDGTNKGSRDFLVRRTAGAKVGGDILAFRPLGGTIGPQLTVALAAQVQWQQLFIPPPNPLRWDFIGCIDDIETIAWTRTRFTKVRGNVAPPTP